MNEFVLTHRFDQRALSQPENIAVEEESRSLTYHELRTLSNGICSQIISRLGPGENPVAIVAGVGMEQVASILGILKARRPYVVLPGSESGSWQQAVWERVGRPLVLGRRQDIQGGGWPYLPLDECPSVDDCPMESASGDMPASIVFTSGSEGGPKGVVRSHRAILHRVQSFQDEYPITPDDRISQFYSCRYAAGEGDLFGALIQGATLCTLTLEGRTVEDILRWLEDRHLTVLHPPVTLLKHLVVDRQSKPFRTIRHLCFGGGVCLTGIG